LIEPWFLVGAKPLEPGEQGTIFDSLGRSHELSQSRFRPTDDEDVAVDFAVTNPFLPHLLRRHGFVVDFDVEPNSFPDKKRVCGRFSHGDISQERSAEKNFCFGDEHFVLDLIFFAWLAIDDFRSAGFVEENHSADSDSLSFSLSGKAAARFFAICFRRAAGEELSCDLAGGGCSVLEPLSDVSSTVF